MNKKQLISSLAVTGIMMGSVVGNAFADSSVVDNPNVTSVDASNLFIADNTGLSTLNNTNSGYINHGPMKHEPQKIDPSSITESTDVMKIYSPDLKDSFIVRVNETSGSSKSNNYQVTEQDIHGNYKEIKQVTGDDYKVTAEIKDNSVDFTVITTNGATLGGLTNSQNKLDSKTEFQNPSKTVEYKFHYTFFGAGERIININLVPTTNVVQEESGTTIDSIQ